jgi:cobalamin biosynthesis Mg chelatase CobN
MTDTEKEQLKQWVETWKRAGPLLEEFRYEELRRFRHEEGVKIIDSLLEMGYQHRVNVPTSGLVELQLLLRKTAR